MSEVRSIHWFRQDLRLADNPSLAHAAESGHILAIYIWDDVNAGDWLPGAASRWWLHHSLAALNHSLNGKLHIYHGDPKTILPKLCKNHSISQVSWNRCYEPWQITRDKELKQTLREGGIEAHTFNGSLLWEPWEVLKADKTPYKVFTPFYRKGCLNAAPPRHPMPTPKLKLLSTEDGVPLESLALLPKIRWDKQLEPHWHIGEQGAQAQLEAFLKKPIHSYKEGRNFPAKQSVSRLSPHLHFGELSPNHAWHAIRMRHHDANADTFCSELGWREFAHSLLYYFPELPTKNWQPKFDAFPWREDNARLQQWQRGMTGYPIVDAGMRELWQTGYMHNRVRMITASFLIKNLLIDWREGERWFWDCLVDADLANNSASWQWVAGSGADAAPYFRIFNPVTQGEKFDAAGEYTRHYVPELANLPDKYLFSPWEAPEDVLKKAGVILGKTYPHPMVDIATSRQRALEAYKEIKGETAAAD